MATDRRRRSVRLRKGKKRKTSKKRKIPKRRRRNRAGFFPLLALAIPALIAAGKAAALGATGGAVAYGVRKLIKKAGG